MKLLAHALLALCVLIVASCEVEPLASSPADGSATNAMGAEDDPSVARDAGHRPGAAGPRCHGESPAGLRIGVFGNTLTTLVADSAGFVVDQNLTVEYLQVTSSTQQFQDLRDGNYDLILTSPDNAVNYRLNASNELGETLDVQAVAGLGYGQNLSLVARPGIESIDELRGGTLAVDAPTSGFAFVLYEMLRRHGLERGVDYELTTAGGVFQRYNALLAGEFDATLLLGGFELRAADAGLTILESVQDAVTPYLGSVAVGREAWLERHRCEVVSLLHAYQRAIRWILDPANRESAIALLMTQSNMSRSLAEALYEIQTTPGVGVIDDLAVDRKALLNVLRLRQEFDGFDRRQHIRFLATPASGLYDESYRRHAGRDGRREERHRP